MTLELILFRLKEEGSNLFANQQNDEPISDTNRLKIENELVSNTNQPKEGNGPVTNCYQLKPLILKFLCLY